METQEERVSKLEETSAVIRAASDAWIEELSYIKTISNNKESTDKVIFYAGFLSGLEYVNKTLKGETK